MRLNVSLARYRIRNFSFIAQTRDILYLQRIAYCKPPAISSARHVRGGISREEPGTVRLRAIGSFRIELA